VKISNSKAKTFRRCPKQYEYKYVLGLRPKTRELPLERGTWMHSLLEAHYLSKSFLDYPRWEKVHKRNTKKFYAMFEEERLGLGDLPDECMRLMRGYLRTYEQEDRHWRTIDTEVNEYVDLPNGLRLNIVVDLIVEDHAGLWLVDHKFRKRFSDTAVSMQLDPQLTLYFWGLQQLGYRPIAGAIYNEVRTKPPTVPKLTKTGRALERRANIDTDIWTYADAVKSHGFDLADYAGILRTIASRQHERFYRRTYLPKDDPVVLTHMRELVMTARQIAFAEREGQFPRTFNGRLCPWDCRYKDLCISELHGGDIQSIIDSSFIVKRGEKKEEDEPKSRREE
jgi:RecB family exonuclease